MNCFYVACRSNIHAHRSSSCPFHHLKILHERVKSFGLSVMASLIFSCEDVQEWMKKEGFQAFADHFYGKKIASKAPN